MITYINNCNFDFSHLMSVLLRILSVQLQNIVVVHRVGPSISKKRVDSRMKTEHFFARCLRGTSAVETVLLTSFSVALHGAVDPKYSVAVREFQCVFHK